MADGTLTRLLPQIYVDATRSVDEDTMCRAALGYARHDGALSHLTALTRWGLPDALPTPARPGPLARPVHVTVPRSCRLRSRDGVQLHRRSGFLAKPPQVLVRAGVPVVRLERAVVDSWPLMRGDAQRAPAITAVANRLTTPERLLTEAHEVPNLGQAAQLEGLLHLLASGCRSHLEIWGCRHVLTHPALPHARRQVPLRVLGGTIYLDVLYEAELVNVELDGSAYHSGEQARERDICRDAALAARGLLVVRYPPRRLYQQPAEVRAELTEILRRRRQQLCVR